MLSIDLRSDTVTQPTEEMRTAMAAAAVGDDVYGEDPTMNRLQEEAAALVGKEAALFMASGTMGNQVAVLSHTTRGNEAMVDAQSHIYYYEAGGPALLGGVQLNPVPGLISSSGPDRLRQALRPADIHFPSTSLVCLENTFNRGGGTVLPLTVMKEIYDLTQEHRLSLHLDGARIFNAATALGVDVREITQYCDSVMFCLSKGLAAPVGSLLCGSRAFIAQARRYRKVMGGGMRQAGILAAAGLVALKGINRLAEDHRNARRLAEGLARLPGLQVDLAKVQTNIVVVQATAGCSAADLVEQLDRRGVKCSTFGPDLIRLVTHIGISAADIDSALQTAGAILSA